MAVGVGRKMRQGAVVDLTALRGNAETLVTGRPRGLWALGVRTEYGRGLAVEAAGRGQLARVGEPGCRVETALLRRIGQAEINRCYGRVAADGWCGYLAIEMIYRRQRVEGANCLNLRLAEDRARFDGFLESMGRWTVDAELRRKVTRLREHLAHDPRPHALPQSTGLWFDGGELHVMGLPFTVLLWTRAEGDVGRLSHPMPTERTIAEWAGVAAVKDQMFWTGDHFLLLDSTTEELGDAIAALQHVLGARGGDWVEDVREAPDSGRVRGRRDVTAEMWLIDEVGGKKARAGRSWRHGARESPQGVQSPIRVGGPQRVEGEEGGTPGDRVGQVGFKSERKRFPPEGPLPEGPPRDFFRRRSSPGRGDGVKDPGR